MVRRLILALVVLAVAFSWPVFAGDDKIEFTPFIGYRFGGDFENYSTGQKYSLDSAESYGFTLDFPTSDETKVELMFSRQPTDLKVDGYLGTERITVDMTYYHVGALYQPSDDEKLQPFVGVTIGATHMKPHVPDTSSETKFSINFTGGVKFHFSEHIGVRLDGRILATIVNGSGGIFCAGGCVFAVGGNALWQGEATAGLIIAF